MNERRTLGLDLQVGLKLWAQEIYGDWYRDPWSWPERKWLQANVDEFDVADYYDPGNRKLRNPPIFHHFDVPKSFLGTRPAVVQDPLSRFLYLASVGSRMEILHRRLPDFVFGWRYRHPPVSARNSTVETEPKKRSENDSEWDAYLAHIKEGSSSEFGLQADITSFFASIEASRMRDEIRSEIGTGTPYHVIVNVIEAHGNLARRSGLPQRSYGSAALANRYVELLDSTLSQALRDKPITRVARWMDDIVAFGSKEALYELYLELQEKSRMIDLELNTAKGRIASAQDVIDSIYSEKIKEVEIAWQELLNDYDGTIDLNSTDVDPDEVDKLLELEQTSLEMGPDATKPWLRATLVSLTRSRNFDRHDEWRSNAPNIPHAADSLGRYLRGATEQHVNLKPTTKGAGFMGSGWTVEPAWDSLNDWLVEHIRSTWCKTDWVKAQLALSVPSDNISNDLRDILVDWLTTSSNAQLMAVAAQRIAKVDPVLTREVVRDRSDSTNDPLLQRVLALSLLTVGGDRTLSETLLRRSPSNALLLNWAVANDWRAPAVSSDFDRA